jgi:putative oxidoreductase
MNSSGFSSAARGNTGLIGAIERVTGWLERVPYSLLALPLRLAVATVFWNSGTTKLANWDATLQLFEDEYQLPLLPPDFAAHLGAGIELSTPVLLVLGLLTRPAALLLLGMTTIIEVFVYPQAWPTHIQWAAMLLVLLCRGPGNYSLDHWLQRRLGGAR